MTLRERIERFASQDEPPERQAREAVAALLDALEAGELRAAEADGTVNAWVKLGIVLGFRVGETRATEGAGELHFRDRDTFPTLDVNGIGRDVRVVPGGTAIRRGAYLGEGVVVMPPAYVNVGARVDRGSMVDSHALVGSCAQVGCNVHLSAAAQIGGVLEPIGAVPVVIGDGAFIGGGCGVYDGTRVGRSAVLAAGVVLTRATPLFDLATGEIHRATADRPLVVPERAVVVPGSRRAAGAFAAKHGLQIATPLIVKYRDEGTDAALELEEALR